MSVLYYVLRGSRLTLLPWALPSGTFLFGFSGVSVSNLYSGKMYIYIYSTVPHGPFDVGDSIFKS